MIEEASDLDRSQISQPETKLHNANLWAKAESLAVTATASLPRHCLAGCPQSKVTGASSALAPQE